MTSIETINEVTKEIKGITRRITETQKYIRGGLTAYDPQFISKIDVDRVIDDLKRHGETIVSAFECARSRHIKEGIDLAIFKLNRAMEAL